MRKVPGFSLHGGFSPVNITHVSYADLQGGAARSAYRLHRGLLSLGQSSKMFVEKRESNELEIVGFRYPHDPLTRLRRGPRRWLLKREKDRIKARLRAGASLFSDDRSEHGSQALAQFPPWDILNLHWISGLLDYSEFFRSVPQNRPVVWTLHDMNAFTGGCHFDGGCGRYSQSCGACPELSSNQPDDFSNAVWKRKRRGYDALRPGGLHLVTPSRWLANEARRSSLLHTRDVTVIPYGIETDVFKPRDRHAARDVLGFPQTSKVVLFLADYADEARKGLSVLLQALGGMSDVSDILVLILGNGTVDVRANLRFKQLDYVRDDRILSMIYSAADLFVAPTLQDNLPNTILEAISCGVPVVAFNVGGVPEIIRDGVEGRLVPCRDIAALRSAIYTSLENNDVRLQMGVNARQRALQEYGLQLQASRYLELYNSLISRANAS